MSGTLTGLIVAAVGVGTLFWLTRQARRSTLPDNESRRVEDFKDAHGHPAKPLPRRVKKMPPGLRRLQDMPDHPDHACFAHDFTEAQHEFVDRVIAELKAERRRDAGWSS